MEEFTSVEYPTYAGKCVVCNDPILANDEKELKDIMRGHIRTCIDCVGLELPRQRAKKNIDLGKYLESSDWEKKKKVALALAGNACQLCKSTHGLQVHHNTYERLGRERHSDLIVLCDRCYPFVRKMIHSPDDNLR